MYLYQKLVSSIFNLNKVVIFFITFICFVLLPLTVYGATKPTYASITLNKSTVSPTETFTASWSGNNSPTSYNIKIGTATHSMGSLRTWSGTPSSLGLSYGVHQIYVQACNSAGCAWSTAKTLTVANPTSQPTYASITLNKSTVLPTETFSANFSGNNSPTYYTININGTDKTTVSANSWSGTPSSIGMSAGQTYTLKVKACNSAGCSSLSSGKTLTVSTPTSQPTYASITLNKSTVSPTETFTTSWSGNNSPTSYNIKIGTATHAMGSLTSWSGTPSSLSLSAGTYQVSVQACNSAGCAWSTAKTLTVANPTSQPTSASITLSKSAVNIITSFTANWSGNNSPTSYNLRIDGVIKPMGSLTSISGTPNQLGLAIGARNIEIQACNSAGCSGWLSKVTLNVVDVPPTSAWLTLSLASIAKTGTFTASWSGNNRPTFYKVKVESAGGISIHELGSVTNWTGTPNDLAMGVGVHRVYSQACNSGGCSPWSSYAELNVTDDQNSIGVINHDVKPTLSSISVNPSVVTKDGSLTATWSGNNSPTFYNVFINGVVKLAAETDTSWSGNPSSIGMTNGTYNIAVQACNAKGCSPMSDIKKLEIADSSIPSPTNANINIIQYPPRTTAHDKVDATWTGDNNPTSYNIKINNTIYDMGAYTGWSGAPTSFGLGIGNHNVYVQACNSGGCSSWSEPALLVVTANELVPTSATFTLNKTSVSLSDNFTATWTGNNNASRFNLLINGTTHNLGNYFSSNGTWTGTPASLGLPVGTHQFRLQACNTGGCSSWSEPVQLMVLNNVVSAPTTSGVIVSPSNIPVDALFTATWSGNNNPTYFNMKINGGDSISVGSSTNWTGTPVSLGLSSGNHTVSAQACNYLGCSSWSSPQPFTVTGVATGEAPSSATLNLRINDDYPLSPINGFCADWSGNNNSTNYNIKVNSTVYAMGNNLGWCGTPAELGLSDGNHTVSAQACNNSGCGPWSSGQSLRVYPVATAPTNANIWVSQPRVDEDDVLTVFWSGNNNPSSYNVMVNSTIYNLAHHDRWTGTPSSIGLSLGLHPLCVMACNSGGCSSWSCVDVTYELSPDLIVPPLSDPTPPSGSDPVGGSPVGSPTGGSPVGGGSDPVGGAGGGGGSPISPIINLNLEANPSIIRSGNTAKVTYSITSDTALVCKLSGGIDTTDSTIDYNASNLNAQLTDEVETIELTSTQIVELKCYDSADTSFSTVLDEAETRITVIPTVQEI